MRRRHAVIDQTSTENNNSEYPTSKIEDDHNETYYIKKHDIFVDHLIKSEVIKFTDEDIRDHSLTILSAVSKLHIRRMLFPRVDKLLQSTAHRLLAPGY